MWVKICGITCADDALAAFEAGADAIGLNFVGGPRRIAVASAQTILDAVPQDGRVVALVSIGPAGVEPSINELLDEYGISHLQVYGEVSTRDIRELVDRGHRLLVVRRPTRSRLRGLLDDIGGGPVGEQLFAVVLDSPPLVGRAVGHSGDSLGGQGGTGRTLDWPAIAQARRRGDLDGWPPIVLAGGLTSDNVGRAIEIVRPWGVDVSSGVESGPGRKDRGAMADFVRSAKNAG